MACLHAVAIQGWMAVLKQPNASEMHPRESFSAGHATVLSLRAGGADVERIQDPDAHSVVVLARCCHSGMDACGRTTKRTRNAFLNCKQGHTNIRSATAIKTAFKIPKALGLMCSSRTFTSAQVSQSVAERGNCVLKTT